jgi:hypothetical protein
MKQGTGAAMTDPGEGGALVWNFGNLRALFINRTRKRSPECSHTQGGNPGYR